MRIHLVLVFCSVLVAGCPVWAGPPFRTDDPEPVVYQHFEINAFSTGVRVAGDTSATLPGIETNYGILPDTQFHVILPMALDETSGEPSHYGFGDAEVGVKYRLLDESETGWWPQIGIFPTVDAPTGDARRNLGAGHAREFFPVWMQKTVGSWTTYGGGGYWINPGGGNRNYWFAGWLLQRQVTDDLAIGGEVFYQTSDRIGDPDSTGFNLGGIYDFSENYHLLFSAGRGIQNATASNEFSYYAAVQWTF